MASGKGHNPRARKISHVWRDYSRDQWTIVAETKVVRALTLYRSQSMVSIPSFYFLPRSRYMLISSSNVRDAAEQIFAFLFLVTIIGLPQSLDQGATGLKSEYSKTKGANAWRKLGEQILIGACL